MCIVLLVSLVLLIVQKNVVLIFYVVDFFVGCDVFEGKIDFFDENCMVNVDLVGGVFLDFGIYVLIWVFQFLYYIQFEVEKEVFNVIVVVNKYYIGVDEIISIIFQFFKYKSYGIVLIFFWVVFEFDNKDIVGVFICIQGGFGEIQVVGFVYCLCQLRVIIKESDGKVEVIDFVIFKDKECNWGYGMFWEVDEVVCCLCDGQKESKILLWSESIVIMEVMDEILKQGGVIYFELILIDVFDF